MSAQQPSMNTVLARKDAGAEMGQRSTPEMAEGTDTQSESRTILHGRWLVFARTVWALTTALAVIMFVISIPARYDQLANHTGDVRVGQSLRAGDPRQLGIAPEFYAGYNVALEVSFALIFSVIAFAIFARKSSDWMALLTSLALLTFGTASIPTTRALVEAQPLWSVPHMILNFVAWASLGAFFFMFPDGRFVPRSMAWVFVLFVAISMVWSFFPNSPYSPERWPDILLVVAILVMFLPPVLSQIYKYRTALGAAQRQQAKWVVFGISVAVLGGIAVTIPGLIDSTLSQPGAQRAFYELAYVPVLFLFLAVLPMSIGIAILRYRLYEIDLIINRALVYLPLTAILAGLYAGIIALFQRLFIAATGEKSDAAIVLTTLILTASFTPIKNSLQATVDRRFKEASDDTRKLKALGKEVESRIYAVDAFQVTRRLLDEATVAFGAKSGALSLVRDGQLTVAHTVGEWKDGDARLSVPLEHRGEQRGLIRLGPRNGGNEYTERDCETLRQVADVVAEAICNVRLG